MLNTAGVRTFINGPETFTPDGKPLIGAMPGIDGLASAFNSAGVTWSAMAGALVADIVAGRSSRFPAERYLPARFGDRAADLTFLREGTSKIVKRVIIASWEVEPFSSGVPHDCGGYTRADE